LFVLFLSLSALLFVSVCKDVTGTDGEVSYETYTITPEGGTHTFDCGITIDVPEGAVTEETEIQFRKMKTSEIHEILEPLGRELSSIIVGFEAKPDGLTFLEDVKVTVQNAGLEPGDFVIVHELDVDSSRYTPAELSFVYNPAEDIIEFSLNHFSGYSAEELEEMEKTECVNDPENCRCKRIKITQSDKHLMCGLGECQKTESKLTVEYLDCGTSETHNLLELSEGCEPEISLTAGRTTIAPWENTTVTAELILGCEGLEGQVVDFSVSDLSLGSVSPTNSTTDGDGQAQTTFTAEKTEGTIAVTVNATVSYYMSVIEADGETFRGPLKTDEVSADVDIKIEQAEWVGIFKAGPFSGCNQSQVVCVQNYSAEVNFTIRIKTDSIIGSAWVGWMGEATVTQSCGSVTPGSPEDWIENLYMPGTFSKKAYGFFLKDSKEITFDFLNDILSDCFKFDLCLELLGEEVRLPVSEFGFREDSFFAVVLEDDEVTKSGQCSLWGVYIWDSCPYTLTLKRRE
jgi:hypothetical protein